MQFDEVCALVGALRDRVAELEAKEAARAESEAPTDPVEIRLDLTGMGGNAEIQSLVEKGLRVGMAASGGTAAPGLFHIGERGPEAIMPTAVRTRG